MSSNVILFVLFGVQCCLLLFFIGFKCENAIILMQYKNTAGGSSSKTICGSNISCDIISRSIGICSGIIGCSSSYRFCFRYCSFCWSLFGNICQTILLLIRISLMSFIVLNIPSYFMNCFSRATKIGIHKTSNTKSSWVECSQSDIYLPVNQQRNGKFTTNRTMKTIALFKNTQVYWKG